eukprot:363193-Chlamydomonas_euryale.AAC.14
MVACHVKLAVQPEFVVECFAASCETVPGTLYGCQCGVLDAIRAPTLRHSTGPNPIPAPRPRAS